MEDYVAAAEILKERGAYKIYIMATHGLLSADAPRLIEESAIDEVKSCVDNKLMCVILPLMSKRHEKCRLRQMCFNRSNMADL